MKCPKCEKVIVQQKEETRMSTWLGAQLVFFTCPHCATILGVLPLTKPNK